MSSRTRSLLSPFLGLLLLGSLGACADSVVEVGSDLELDMTGPSSIALSDSLTVDFEARGRSLLGFVLRYGDGAVDSVRLVGSQTAGGRLHHLYEESGTYTVIGEVQDGIEGNIMAEITVTVSN